MWLFSTLIEHRLPLAWWEFPTSRLSFSHKCETHEARHVYLYIFKNQGHSMFAQLPLCHGSRDFWNSHWLRVSQALVLSLYKDSFGPQPIRFSAGWKIFVWSQWASMDNVNWDCIFGWLLKVGLTKFAAWIGLGLEWGFVPSKRTWVFQFFWFIYGLSVVGAFTYRVII